MISEEEENAIEQQSSKSVNNKLVPILLGICAFLLSINGTLLVAKFHSIDDKMDTQTELLQKFLINQKTDEGRITDLEMSAFGANKQYLLSDNTDYSKVLPKYAYIVSNSNNDLIAVLPTEVMCLTYNKDNKNKPIYG